MKIPILALIFQGIPEQIAVAALAFVIANIPLIWKRIVLIGTIIAVSSYILRFFLPITFGIHTVLMIGLLFVLLIVLGKGNINSSLLASLLSFLSLIVAETICLSILMPLFGATLESMTTDAPTRIVVGLPQVFVILILTYVIYKFKKIRSK